MSKDNNLHDFLQDVADAIKEKKGSNEPINAQNFAEEIKNLPSGSSPFAVDFGEDVTMQSTEMIDSLKEDLEYYYEIERQRAAGEVTDSELLNSEEFQRKIAWWPKGMALPNTQFLYRYSNMRVINWKFPSNSYNRYPYTSRHLSIFAPDVSKIQVDFGLFLVKGNIECPVSLKFDLLTKCRGNVFTNISCPNLVVDMPLLQSYTGDFMRNIFADIISLKAPSLASGVNLMRDIECREMYADISSMTTSSFCFYNNNNTQKVLKVKGLQVSINISSCSNLGLDSIKYILDNCQAREDGASYTLTLDAAVKTAFLAKCDEDSEYAASLASANAKGLTLA